MRPFATSALCLLAFLAPALAANESIFEPGAKLKVEAGGGAGGEGPAWHPKFGVLSSGNNQIYQLNRDGKSRIWRKDAGTNGRSSTVRDSCSPATPRGAAWSASTRRTASSPS